MPYAAVGDCNSSLVKCMRSTLGCERVYERCAHTKCMTVASLPDCNIKDMKTGALCYEHSVT